MVDYNPIAVHNILCTCMMSEVNMKGINVMAGLNAGLPKRSAYIHMCKTFSTCNETCPVHSISKMRVHDSEGALLSWLLTQRFSRTRRA